MRGGRMESKNRNIRVGGPRKKCVRGSTKTKNMWGFGERIKYVVGSPPIFFHSVPLMNSNGISLSRDFRHSAHIFRSPRKCWQNSVGSIHKGNTWFYTLYYHISDYVTLLQCSTKLDTITWSRKAPFGVALELWRSLRWSASIWKV